MTEQNPTKRALADACKQLMQTKRLSKISVSAICEACGMSRKGFYYHFKDKYDLVNWIFESEFVLPAQQKDYADIWAFLLDLCRYFYAYRKFYINAFLVEGQNSFTEYLADALRPHARAYFDEAFANERFAELYADFLVDAFRLAILRWLQNTPQLTPEQFILLVRRATEGISMRLASGK